MVFSVVYQTLSTLPLGKTFTSTHKINDLPENATVSYSSSSSGSGSLQNDSIVLNKLTGNFTIKAETVGKLQFTISVFISTGCGYKVPFQIDIVNEDEPYVQYLYNTSYPSFSAFPLIAPDHIPEGSHRFSMIGAPLGITINQETGAILGKPSNSGKFLMTITLLDIDSGEFVCNTILELIIYTANEIEWITGCMPSNNIIYSKNIPVTVHCTYNGAPPSLAQSIHYTLTSTAFESTSLINYNIGEELIFVYLVNIANTPGAFPIFLQDNISGFFIQSDFFFTVTAACFNEDTTVLVKNGDDETYKAIKDIVVGDEVVAYKHGFKKVTHIGSRTMVNNPDSISDCMYKLCKSNKYPDLTHDLILLGRHSILVDKLTKKQERKTLEIHPVDKIDDKELLITMFNDEFEIVEDRESYTYYHLVLEREKDKVDRKYGIYVNGGEIVAATSKKSDFLNQFSNK